MYSFDEMCASHKKGKKGSAKKVESVFDKADGLAEGKYRLPTFAKKAIAKDASQAKRNAETKAVLQKAIGQKIEQVDVARSGAVVIHTDGGRIDLAPIVSLTGADKGDTHLAAYFRRK